MESVQKFKSITKITPDINVVTPKAITYSGNENNLIHPRNSTNYFLNYSVIKETLIKGLHPKYLSSAEKEIMIEREGGGWYDKWALFNE